MTPSLRIAIADDEPDILEYYQVVLRRLGHVVVAAARTGSDLIEQCRTLKPQLIITDIRMPEDGITAAERLYEDGPIPVILISGYHHEEYISRAMGSHILAYLVKPIQDADLETAIAIVMHRFREFETLRGEAADLRQALADRKIIEQAKGILMKWANLDEQEAFRRMRQLSMEQNRKLVDIAQMLLTAEKALTPPAKS